MHSVYAQIKRDLTIAWRSRQDVAVMLIFFVIIIALFPLAFGPSAAILKPLAVPIIWIAALLSILAGFDSLFADDVRDGWLDQISIPVVDEMSGEPAIGGFYQLGLYALAKAVAHWVKTGVPLLLTTPLMAIMLAMPLHQLGALIVALAVGSCCLTLLGIMGAALAHGARRGGGLMALLVLPLAVPVLIFGVMASQPNMTMIVTPHLMLLGALALLLLALAPPVAAMALIESDGGSGS
ncbi:heme exporter protein CcmB [Candidatus Puniceispirillum sp.]|uniref:heme exporter protein CcmB n=1 Tax=Candidatus Puniceispirillum sp. TaxID=2026719 RepID=UPI003F695E8B